jgi:hypothetical protein
MATPLRSGTSRLSHELCALYRGHRVLSLRQQSQRDAPPRSDLRIGAAVLAYVHWATLSGDGDKTPKFEQGSALAGYSGWECSEELLTDDDETSVVHSPTHSML